MLAEISPSSSLPRSRRVPTRLTAHQQNPGNIPEHASNHTQTAMAPQELSNGINGSSKPSLMKAVRFHGKGDLRLENIPEPHVGPSQVKVRHHNTCASSPKTHMRETPLKADILTSSNPPGSEFAEQVEAPLHLQASSFPNPVLHHPPALSA
ncbi:hypothetical protein BKA80DRAFT_259485 [Phyllosticta citrichinensis]